MPPLPLELAQPVASPLHGTWAVDVARLAMPPEARPRRVQIRFAPAPDGRLSTLVEVAEDGESVLLDGSADPLQNQRMERADALDCLGAPGVAAQIRDFT